MRHPRWIGLLFQTIVRLIGAARFTRASAGWVAMLAMCATMVLWQPMTGSEFPIRTWSDARLRLPELHADRPSVEVAGSDEDWVLGAARSVPRLDKEQTNLAQFIAQRYRVALDKTQFFVDIAYRAAREYKMDPWLLLAVMAVESGFDPWAVSPAGAHGLMQVLTRVHADKFVPFGGIAAAFDPIVNVKVGTQILREYIYRYGSTEAALKSYVGAALMDDDAGYGSKVLAERERLAAIAAGRPVPLISVARNVPSAGAAGFAATVVSDPFIQGARAEPDPAISTTGSGTPEPTAALPARAFFSGMATAQVGADPGVAEVTSSH
jgi:hypothetical protein